MTRELRTALVLLALAMALGPTGSAPAQTSSSASEEPVTAKLEVDRVEVRARGDLFTTYKFADTLKYPYFYPVNGPASGRSVTTESSEPWPHHHSLFLGCDRVNGGNYWQEGLNRGRIASESVEIPVARGDSAVIMQRTRWRRPGTPAPFAGERRIVIRAPSSEIRTIDVSVTLEALVPVTIRRTNHALFSARMVPALSVDSGGTLVNADGDAGEAETWGRRSPWADYYGTRRDGTTEGLAILTHPSNPWYPAPWFTRNYGFFSPTPMQWLADGRFDLEEGETLTLRYRVLVHTGDPEEARIGERYARWAPDAGW